MDYYKALKIIEETAAFGSTPGLKNIRRICRKLEVFKGAPKFIHVGGTNGKGSTVQFMSHILCAAGYKTGAYISPHINDFRERITINGEMISKDDFAKCAEKVFAVMPPETTEFEITTAMAFLYFKEQGCDYAVIEVGMGGRLDATNIIPKPEIAIITEISKDHTQYLGHTLKEIAKEKMGIMKCTTVIAPQEPTLMKEFHHYAFMKAVPLRVAPRVEDYELTLNYTAFSDYDIDRCWQIKMLGVNQISNAINAIIAAEELHIDPIVIQKGLINAYIPYRFEIAQLAPQVVVKDAAHNPGGAACLAENLRNYFPNQKIGIKIGVLADKDYEGVLQALAPVAAEFLPVQTDSPRALPAAELAKVCQKYGKVVQKFSDNIDVICICGSFTMFRETPKEDGENGS